MLSNANGSRQIPRGLSGDVEGTVTLGAELEMALITSEKGPGREGTLLTSTEEVPVCKVDMGWENGVIVGMALVGGDEDGEVIFGRLESLIGELTVAREC